MDPNRSMEDSGGDTANGENDILTDVLHSSSSRDGLRPTMTLEGDQISEEQQQQQDEGDESLDDDDDDDDDSNSSSSIPPLIRRNGDLYEESSDEEDGGGGDEEDDDENNNNNWRSTYASSTSTSRSNIFQNAFSHRQLIYSQLLSLNNFAAGRSPFVSFPRAQQQQPNTSVKCPLCNMVHASCPLVQSMGSPRYQCSHNARPAYVSGHMCPICWEESNGDEPMVNLACGHLVCRHDFERLGGTMTKVVVEEKQKEEEEEEKETTTTAASSSTAQAQPTFAAETVQHPLLELRNYDDGPLLGGSVVIPEHELPPLIPAPERDGVIHSEPPPLIPAPSSPQEEDGDDEEYSSPQIPRFVALEFESSAETMQNEAWTSFMDAQLNYMTTTRRNARDATDRARTIAQVQSRDDDEFEEPPPLMIMEEYYRREPRNHAFLTDYSTTTADAAGLRRFWSGNNNNATTTISTTSTTTTRTGRSAQETVAAASSGDDSTQQQEQHDIAIVMDQTGCTQEAALEALAQHEGDLIDSIMSLTAGGGGSLSGPAAAAS